MKTSKSPDLWFSEDNWGDYFKVEHGRRVIYRRATKYLKTINSWGPAKWEKILDGTREFCEDVCAGLDPAARLDSESNIVEEVEGEKEFILVSDDDS